MRFGRRYALTDGYNAMLMARTPSASRFGPTACPLATFAKITDALVAAGRIRRQGDTYPAELGIKTKRMVP